MKENSTVEFKTSLFYRPGSSESGDEQISVIIRALAAFMNSEGGDLYIGMDDRGFPVADIVAEYRLMNFYPAYQGAAYGKNEDGYKRFIQDWASKFLGNFAVSLLRFEFINVGVVKVCKISVSKSPMPVWFNRESLYVRCDASTRRLMGDDINRFYMCAGTLQANDAATNNLPELVRKAKSNIVPSAKMQRILVVYPNGDFVYEKSGRATMIEAIRRAGIKNVMGLDLVGRKGNKKTPFVPFIGTQEYRDNSGATQTLEGDYFIFTKYSIGDLIEKLGQISLGLGLGLHIEKY